MVELKNSFQNSTKSDVVAHTCVPRPHKVEVELENFSHSHLHDKIVSPHFPIKPTKHSRVLVTLCTKCFNNLLNSAAVIQHTIKRTKQPVNLMSASKTFHPGTYECGI